jgi:uncharacterized protein
MGNKFGQIAFTPSVKKVQTEQGSREHYAAAETRNWHNGQLGDDEAEFIRSRDSFYMASVSESDWPYVQHRGGPAGFVKVLDSKTIGFADYRGNRQYISVGNLVKNDRVALLFMDYPNRSRLKMLGHAELVRADRKELMSSLAIPDYKARVERGFVVHVSAFDWNCPQHITPRYTQLEVETVLRPLQDRVRALEEELAQFKISTHGL